MSELKLQRIAFSEDADTRLRMMKSRTGITPNLLGRIGFCLSLEEPGIPIVRDNFKPGREINRYTLLGKFDSLMVALLNARMVVDGIDLSMLDEMFTAHMNRGVELLTSRVKTLGDFQDLVRSEPDTE